MPIYMFQFWFSWIESLSCYTDYVLFSVWVGCWSSMVVLILTLSNKA